MDLPYLSAADVERHLTPVVAIDALEAALANGLDPENDPARRFVGLEHGELILMPSEVSGHVAVKLVTIGGDPRVQGVVVVFDGTTLAPAALIDGIALTNVRTLGGLRAGGPSPRARGRVAPADLRPRPAGACARRGDQRDPPDRAGRPARPRSHRRGRARRGRRHHRLRHHGERAAVRRLARRRPRDRRRDRHPRSRRARDRRRPRAPCDGRRRVPRLGAARGRRRDHGDRVRRPDRRRAGHAGRTRQRRARSPTVRGCSRAPACPGRTR